MAFTATMGPRFIAYGRGDGLPGTFVRTLHVDASGRLWVGTTDGLGVSGPAGHFSVVKYQKHRPEQSGTISAIFVFR